MPKVFISHSWKDNGIARKLAENLKRDGADVWIDFEKVKAKNILYSKISKAIEECDVVVIIWSKFAKNSKNIELEWNSALAEKKPIIPCQIDDTELPAMLKPYIFINLINFEQGYFKLTESLHLAVSNTNNLYGRKVFEEDNISASKKPIFRTKPEIISREDVIKMLKSNNFFDISKNSKGKGFANEFEEQQKEGGIVIIDYASGLMWEQGGSTNKKEFHDALIYIKMLNDSSFWGFDNWRLPTLEEAMSLMKPFVNKEKLFVDSKFSAIQDRIWTLDTAIEYLLSWVVFFTDGKCTTANKERNSFFVRAVRSMNKF